MEAKLTQLNSRDLINNALDQMERETGFHIKKRYFTSSYFVFEGEDDSICQFFIEEIPRFRFAVWNTNRYDSIENCIKEKHLLWSDSLQVDSKSELIFFTQYENELDKFKPSRSGFVKGIYRQAWEEENDEGKVVKKEEWIMYDIAEILEYMHKHPIKSYVYTGAQINDVWNEINGFRCLRIYVKECTYRWRSNLKEYIKKKINIFRGKHFCKKLTCFETFIADYENVTPSLHINLRRKDKIDNLEEYEKQVTLIDNFEDKYWNPFSFNEWCIYLTKESTQEDIEEDKDLRKRFYECYKTCKDDRHIKLIFEKDINQENLDKLAK